MKTFNFHIDITENFSIEAKNEDEARNKLIEEYNKHDIVWSIEDADITLDISQD